MARESSSSSSRHGKERHLSSLDIDRSKSVDDVVNETGTTGAQSGSSLQTPYATVQNLAPWLPETDPTSKRAQTLSVKMADRSTMLIIQLVTAFVAAFVVISTIVLSIKKYPLIGDTGTFYSGKCSEVQSLDSRTHLLLNVVGTLFLGAGSYTMQVMVAPSRQEVNNAHSKGLSLDIGTHSIHNLRWIPRNRMLLWLFLGVFATPLHLFWNSAVFSSIPFRVFPVAIVTADFISASDAWITSNPVTDPTIAANASSIYALQLDARNYTRMENAECITTYVDPRVVTSDLVMVSNVSTRASAQHIAGGRISSLLDGWISGSDHDHWNVATKWICSSLYTDDKYWTKACIQEVALPLAEDWVVLGYGIQHCLVGPSGDNEELCGFHFSRLVFVVVSICMLFEALAIAWGAFRKERTDPDITNTPAEMTSREHDTTRQYRQPGNEPLLSQACSIISPTPQTKNMGTRTTLVTLGDAQASFLQDRDPWTDSEANEPLRPRSFARLQIGKWCADRPFWFRAVSARMWIATVVLITAAVMLGAILYHKSIHTLELNELGSGFKDVITYGFGRTNTFALVGGPLGGSSNSLSFVGHILFVNSFQVMLSILYLFYNNCLTCQVVAAEWARFMDGSERKSLRVSAHVGMQRSTYMLSLPWTYAVPLLAAFITLHTLVSRSGFIVQTAGYTAGPNAKAHRILGSDASRVGYSSLGILLSTLLGSAMFLALIINSFRRYPAMPAYLPRLATSTAFISAACQRPEGDGDAHLFPLKFYAVQRNPDVAGGRKALHSVVLSTDRDSVPPQPGLEYGQPMPVGNWDDWAWLATVCRQTCAGYATMKRRVKKSTTSLAGAVRRVRRRGLRN